MKYNTLRTTHTESLRQHVDQGGNATGYAKAHCLSNADAVKVMMAQNYQPCRSIAAIMQRHTRGVGQWKQTKITH